MSAIARDDYVQATSRAGAAARPVAWPLRRLLIAMAGCAIMALSGSGLASYLDTSSAGGGSAEAATIN